MLPPSGVWKPGFVVRRWVSIVTYPVVTPCDLGKVCHCLSSRIFGTQVEPVLGTRWGVLQRIVY